VKKVFARGGCHGGALDRDNKTLKKLNNYIITVVERAAVSAAAQAASETDREMADLIPGYDKVRTVGKGNARTPMRPPTRFSLRHNKHVTTHFHWID
jgi:hypothetical protein